jgi:hypothetical protein
MNRRQEFYSVSQLYDMRMKIEEKIKADGLNALDVKGKFALKTGRMLALITATTTGNQQNDGGERCHLGESGTAANVPGEKPRKTAGTSDTNLHDVTGARNHELGVPHRRAGYERVLARA